MPNRGIEAMDIYSKRRAIATGILDLGAFTTNAHELKRYSMAYAEHPTTYDYIFIILIVLSMVLQVSRNNFFEL